MPTISAGEFRKGMIFEMEGKPMLVVDFQVSVTSRSMKLGTSTVKTLPL